MLTSLFIIFIIIYLSWFFFLILARSRLVLSVQKKKKGQLIKVREEGGGCSCDKESVCLCGQLRSLDLHVGVIDWSVSLVV